jgi:hypothetical protein
MLEVRKVRVMVGGAGTGMMARVPENGEPMTPRSSEGAPVLPAKASPVGSDDVASLPRQTLSGMCPGNLIRPLYGTICTDEPRNCSTGLAGPGSTLPKLIGVETVRARGSPTVVNNGIVRSIPIATACTPNEVRVVQLLCPRCVHEVSSKLSANIVSSSIEVLFALMDTATALAEALVQ